MKRLLIVATAVSVLLAACSESPAAPSTQEPSASTTTLAPAPTTTTTSAPTTTSPSATTTTTTPTTTADPLNDRWIAVLASLPTGDFSQEDAEHKAAEMTEPELGVLLSDDHGSLNAGFWVVYSGTFDQSWQAWERCEQVAGDCYARYVGGDPTVTPSLANGQLLVWLEGDLKTVAVDSGAVLRTVASGWGDGQFVGPPDIALNGETAYFGVGTEDFWFSCESTLGSFVEMELSSGAVVREITGLQPEVSPDGDKLAYLAADGCQPDPQEAQFYIAYHNQVVVRDLEDGTEMVWGPAPGTEGPATTISGIAWSSDGTTLFVGMDDRTVRVLPTDTPGSTPIDDLDQLAFRPVHSPSRVLPIGQLPTGEVVLWVAAIVDDAHETSVYLVDRATGETTTIASNTAIDPLFANMDRESSTVLLWSAHRAWSVGVVEFDISFDRYVLGTGG